MLIITEKTNLPKGFKLPRKKKKAFKIAMVGTKSSVTLKPDCKTDTKKVLIEYVKMMHFAYMMRRYNVRGYGGMTVRTQV